MEKCVLYAKKRLRVSGVKRIAINYSVRGRAEGMEGNPK